MVRRTLQPQHEPSHRTAAYSVHVHLWSEINKAVPNTKLCRIFSSTWEIARDKQELGQSRITIGDVSESYHKNLPSTDRPRIANLYVFLLFKYSLAMDFTLDSPTLHLFS